MIDTSPLKPRPIVHDLQGNLITSEADLPPADTVRWVANKKAILVRAVRAGIISREAALERYNMEEKELAIWEKEFATYGANGLMATKIQTRRKDDVSK